MLVFYDIETTGTNIEYDQILQFAAILTDDALKEIDRFEIRCRLLPWVVPSPTALLVTGIDVDLLTEHALPTFYEMMVEIRERLLRWAPAVFVGYNSMRFDEPILQRAFWQTLLPPYMTVTDGNARLDILPFARAVAHFRPGVIAVPIDEDGKSSFRLEKLAPLNGFNGHRAHEALGDVEATLFMARLLSDRAPALWLLHRSRSPKAETASVLAFGLPVLVFQYVGGKPVMWFGQRVDHEDGGASHAIVAMLGYDWQLAKSEMPDAKDTGVARAGRPARRIALNKAPVIFTLDEAKALYGLSLSSSELQASCMLASEEQLCDRIVRQVNGETTYPPGSGELEETIFDGFPSKSDEDLMRRFHDAEWSKQTEVASTFKDERFRRLAMRMLYISAPSLMPPAERKRIHEGVAERITMGKNEAHPWRSISDALTELDQIAADRWGIEKLSKIRSWLLQRKADISS